MNINDSPVTARKNRRSSKIGRNGNNNICNSSNSCSNNDNDLRRRHDTPPFTINSDYISSSSSSSSSQHKSVLFRRRREVAMAMAVTVTLLVALTLLWRQGLRSNNGQQRLQLQQKQNNQSPLVCSHQLLNPPPLRPAQTTSSHSIIPPADGSIDAMTAFWYNGGVTCFDIDVVVLSDGTMLATHPRRINAAIVESLRNSKKDENENENEIVLEEYTLDSIRDVLGLLVQNNNDDDTNNNLRSSGGGGRGSYSDSKASPFPLFDEELLPHYAKLVRGIPGAFSGTTSTTLETTTKTSPPPSPPWALRGPLLNIDLKLGPYLTEERVLQLVDQIVNLGLENYVAVCVTPPPTTRTTKDEIEKNNTPAFDLLDVMQRFNTNYNNIQTTRDYHQNNNNHHGGKRIIIPLGLVLRDLVPEDADVNRVKQLVEELYPESIKLMVASFKFPKEWYSEIRSSDSDSDSDNENKKSKSELRRLPMTVWTIDSKEDYRYVASMTTTVSDSDSDSNALVMPMASAVVANRPMEIIG